MPTFPYYVRRFRELGFLEGIRQADEIIRSSASRLLKRAYDRYLRVDLTDADLLKRCCFGSSLELAQHFKNRTTPHFFFSKDIASSAKEFQAQFADQADEILERAALVMSHKFDLLGSGLTDLDDLKEQSLNVVGRNGRVTAKAKPSGYLPWHADFKSGTAWDSSIYYKDIRYGNLDGVDVKVPWELSRFQHLLVLGQAYVLTNDEQYAKEFVREVSDWIDKNPCRHGVNWSCTMEVGIRVVNWIWAFHYFRTARSVDEQFLLTFLRGVYVHAQFIRGNLEFRKAWVSGRERRLNSNHYLSDLIGLLYVSVLFPEFRLDQYPKFATRELETELFAETSPDGTNYEHSTSYHRLVLEIFLSGFLLLKLNGYVLSPAICERLERMARFVAAYTRSDRTAPQVGDSDDGRLHPLALRAQSDHTYLVSVAANMLDCDELRGQDDPEVWWWTGSSTRGNPPELKSEGYPDGGFYIMRSNNVHVFVAAATVGMCGLGSHSHNDILSFEYWCNGRSWIVDPGTYLYTPNPEARNLFRSTVSHNGLRIDGAEINPIDADQLFQIHDQAKVFVSQWSPGNELDVLEAEHSGYMRLPGRIRHRRRVELNKCSGDLLVHDQLEGTGRHVFEWFFHLHPDVRVRQDGDSVFLLKTPAQAVRLATLCTELNARIDDGWYSPSYGIRKKTAVIVLQMESVAPFSVEFSIGPVK